MVSADPGPVAPGSSAHRGRAPVREEHGDLRQLHAEARPRSATPEDRPQRQAAGGQGAAQVMAVVVGGGS